MWLNDLVILWKGLLTMYPHPAKTDSHRHCLNGYIVILVSHMILQDHVTLWVEVTQGKSSYCGTGDKMFLVC